MLAAGMTVRWGMHAAPQRFLYLLLFKIVKFCRHCIWEPPGLLVMLLHHVGTRQLRPTCLREC
jgi:hypothetical protein